MTTKGWSYLLIWEFEVKQNFEAEFERAYGSQGEWANFFRRDPNYCGTDLVRDPSQRGRYVTLDYWTSRADYDNFRLQHTDEYKKIDERCEQMTEKEAALGAYERLVQR